MNKEEYNKLAGVLEAEYLENINAIKIAHGIRLNKLKLEYINSSAEFKKGQFIFNVTGIIKIEKIEVNNFRGGPNITYYGYRYKKEKGVLSRTKGKEMSSISSDSKLAVYDKVIQ